MRAHHPASLLPAVLCALAACTEPQTPASEGAGAEAATTTPTAVPTLTAVPTGTSSVTAPATATATATAAPVEKLEAPYVLTFRQEGGIAGMLMETIVDTGAKRITYGGLRNQKPEARELTAEDVEKITRAVEEARFASFPGKIKSGPIADAFTYTITVRSGGKEYMVSWSDGTNVPDAYSNLRAMVNAVRASKFDGVSPRGAATM